MEQAQVVYDVEVGGRGATVGADGDVDAAGEHVAPAVGGMVEVGVGAGAVDDGGAAGGEEGEFVVGAVVDVGEEGGVGEEAEGAGEVDGAGGEAGDEVVPGVEGFPEVAEGAGVGGEEGGLVGGFGQVRGEGEIELARQFEAALVGVGFDGVGSVGGEGDAEAVGGVGGVEGGGEALVEEEAALGEGLDFAVADDALGGLAEEGAGEVGVAGDVAEGGDAEAEGLLDANGESAGEGGFEGWRGGGGAGDHVLEPLGEGGGGGRGGEVGEFEVGVGVDQTREDEGVGEVDDLEIRVFAMLRARRGEEVVGGADGENLVVVEEDGAVAEEGAVDGGDELGEEEGLHGCWGFTL